MLQWFAHPPSPVSPRAAAQIAGAFDFLDASATKFNVGIYYNNTDSTRGQPLPYQRVVSMLDRAANAWLGKNYAGEPLLCWCPELNTFQYLGFCQAYCRAANAWPGKNVGELPFLLIPGCLSLSISGLFARDFRCGLLA